MYKVKTAHISCLAFATKKTGTALQRDSSFSYVPMSDCSETY